MGSMCRSSPKFRVYPPTETGRRTRIASNNRIHVSQSCRGTSVVTIVRRSANYQPSIWSFDYIQSLSTKYSGENYASRTRILKEAVKTMFCQEIEPLKVLDLVDDLERLGVSYHFVNEISTVLEDIYNKYYKSRENWSKLDLNRKSVGFRLLRQHGYDVPQEIFLDVKDKKGNFKTELCDDMMGMLNLYEASYLSVGDESVLDEARGFAARYVEGRLADDTILDRRMSGLMGRALVLPLHWRVPRVEARWFIGAYERRKDMNPMLMELAKLDFNMVQAIHQQDLKYSSRWWRSTGWEKFRFTRDRIMENFLWTIGVNYTPSFKGRVAMTKVNALITTIDDVYDVYGTLDELERFTDAVSRWDTEMIKELPDYMKECFYGLHSSINEMAYETLTNKGFFSLPYLKKAWEDLCKAYLTEAKWYHRGYTPTFKEYMNNSCISISTPVILVHAYLLTSSRITVDALQTVGRAESIVGCVCLIMRLTNDLSTSPYELKRGDVPKSIQCYMHENGATEEEARAYIKTMIRDTWKRLNKECERVDSLFERPFIESATNLARMSHLMYGNGDGHGCPEVVRSHVSSLLINPIQDIS